MKLPATLILVFPLLLHAQSKNVAFQAFGKGDVETLSSLFDQDIELCFNGKIEIVDRQGATKALRAFFEKNTPKGITPMHKGTSKDNDSQYNIGLLSTQSGQVYRVYIYAELVNGKSLIKEIRIDKESG